MELHIYSIIISAAKLACIVPGKVDVKKNFDFLYIFIIH